MRGADVGLGPTSGPGTSGSPGGARRHARVILSVSARADAGRIPAGTSSRRQTDPDAPARTAEPSVPPAHFRPTWDLDGLYLWLGPIGAASHVDDAVGLDVRRRLRRWSGSASATARRDRRHARRERAGPTRDGGQVWLDGARRHPRARPHGRRVARPARRAVRRSRIRAVGGSVGLWAFVGVTPVRPGRRRRRSSAASSSSASTSPCRSPAAPVDSGSRCGVPNDLPSGA